MLRRIVIASILLILLIPSAFADALTLPTPPMNVSVTLSEGNATVSWDAPASDGGGQVLYYRVYRDDALVADNIIVEEFVDPLPQTEAAATTSYYVTAVNEAGESAPGNDDADCLWIIGIDPGACVGLAIALVWWVVDQLPP